MDKWGSRFSFFHHVLRKMNFGDTLGFLCCMEGAPVMEESSLEALMFDPGKCRQLSMEQKRDLVYEVSKWSDGATEMLQAWSRHDILQVLCAELGKERKYTGLTKSKMIEHLLKIVYDNKSHGVLNNSEKHISFENGERTPKRQRKCDQLNFLPMTATQTLPSTTVVYVDSSVYCKNSACKARMNSDDTFCKRCSCCICHQYDDNKDPSLWLICNSDPPFHGMSCSMSCHLECAFRHEKSGILTDRQDKGLDGSFCCVSCGKVNDLLGSWRKQLAEARDTRRVDILCYRLSLGQKILDGTKHYKKLCSIVGEAVNKLEEDVGPLTGVPVKKARGIVNRLASGPDIQKLCALAVESLDMMLSSRVSSTPEKFVHFEDIQASTVKIVLHSPEWNLENAVSYSLWHRKANDTVYPSDPTCRLHPPNRKFLLSGLAPATNYFLKVVTIGTDRDMGFCEFQFQTESSQDEVLNLNSPCLEMERSHSPVTNCSSLSNPSSVEDETNNMMPSGNEDENVRDNYLPFYNSASKTVTAKLSGDTINCSNHSQDETTEDASFLDQGPESHALNVGMNVFSNGTTVEGKTHETGLECVPFVDCSETGLPITPCKLEKLKNVNRRGNKTKLTDNNNSVTFKGIEEPQAGCPSEKISGEIQDSECMGTRNKDFEYHVKIIRWLECEGHIETTFRRKFLTWYSMRATPQEVRIVKVYIKTFTEDPSSLAGQLIDTFSEVISNQRCSTVPPGFCLKLWH